MTTSKIIKFAKKPNWLKVSIPQGKNYQFIKNKRKNLGLATVCEEARCPNIGECWETGTATFMILGDTCTRGCRFCSVKTSRKPDDIDPFEPRKLAKTIKELKLKYIVLTTVDRDDMEDQGSKHIRKCIESVKNECSNIAVEILMPDFRGEMHLVDEIIYSMPAVMAHNIETVPRLTSMVRDPRATYQQSMDVLRYIKKKNSQMYTKSSLMVGFGETQEEILQSMADLRNVGVEFLTIGQYLKPNAFKLDVQEYIHPEIFQFYKEKGEKMGFEYVASGPLVRSSYKAAEHFIHSKIQKRKYLA